MNERRLDFELLQRFTREREQSAFADVVRRHLDLVFATALRKTGDHDAAQEIAQNVFAALARKAWQFAPDDSLPAWLHKTALFHANTWLRGELRRRRREQAAAELGTTMNTPEHQPAFQALVPLLDEALLSLREKDRTALLLRFYENQSLRDVGTALGAGEDAARKRVQGALEKLVDFFKRRGFKTASVAVATAALEHTATTASAAVVEAVVNAALHAAPPALAGVKALLARLASLTKGQKIMLCGAVAVALLPWLWRDRESVGREPQPVATQLASGTNTSAQQQGNAPAVRTETARPAQPNPPAKEVAAAAPVNTPARNPPADQPLPPTRRLWPAAWKATWAPDSKRLAFTRYSGKPIDSQEGIAVLELESGTATDLTPVGKDPAWSPDGKFIAFVGNRGGREQNFDVIFVIPAGGGEPVKFRDGGWPAWTPDSKRVLFRQRGGKVVSVPVNAPQEEPTVFCETPGSSYPAISPDGLRVAFGTQGMLKVLETKTGQLVASLPSPSFFAGWSPDGRQVVFGGGISAWPGLWIFDVERGGAFQVATDGTRAAWSPDGKRLVYDVLKNPNMTIERPERTRELWVIETAFLPRHPVLTNQIPPFVPTNQVPAPVAR